MGQSRRQVQFHGSVGFPGSRSKPSAVHLELSKQLDVTNYQHKENLLYVAVSFLRLAAILVVYSRAGGNKWVSIQFCVFISSLFSKLNQVVWFIFLGAKMADRVMFMNLYLRFRQKPMRGLKESIALAEIFVEMEAEQAEKEANRAKKEAKQAQKEAKQAKKEANKKKRHGKKNRGKGRK